MLIVDPLTGAMYKLPEFASADMGKPLADAAAETLKVGVIDDLTPAQRERLIPVNRLSRVVGSKHSKKSPQRSAGQHREQMSLHCAG